MSKRLVLSACALVLLSGSALAKPGLATTNVNLRAASNTTSEVLAKIPAGAPIDVGDCTDGWCAVTYQDKNGFAIATALDTSGRPRAVRRAPRAAGPDDDFVPVARGYRPYPVAPPVYALGVRLGLEEVVKAPLRLHSVVSRLCTRVAAPLRQNGFPRLIPDCNRQFSTGFSIFTTR